MGMDSTFDVLSTLIDGCETAGLTVRSVEAVTDGPEGSLEASLTVPLPLGTGDGPVDPVTPAGAQVSTEGTLEVSYRLPDLAGYAPEESSVSTVRRSARVTDDEVVVDLVLRIRTPPAVRDDGTKPDADPNSPNRESVGADPSRERDHASANGQGDPRPASTEQRGEGRSDDADDGSSRPGVDDTRPLGDGEGPDDRTAGDRGSDGGASDTDANGHDSDVEVVEEPRRGELPRDESVPPYEDTRYLEALYESCDTFAEMSRLIEMDVSAETVRRYSIDAGVHEPDSYDTASRDAAAVDAMLPDAGEVADAVDLPDGLDLTDVVDAVAGARSVHEVARELELERSRAQEVLRTLDIIDLVSFRLTDVPDRATSPEEVATRIKRRIPEAA